MSGDARADREALYRLAYDIASREGPLPGGECPRGDCREIREELVGVEVLLEGLAGQLFGPGDARHPETGGRGSSSATSVIASALSLQALLTAAMLVLAVVGIWHTRADPVSRPAERWRSSVPGGVDVSASVEGRSLLLRWQETTAAHWYRVSLVSASGEVLARRDLEGGCECRVEVGLPETGGVMYWLVEAFDASWDRSALASGRIAAPASSTRTQ